MDTIDLLKAHLVVSTPGIAVKAFKRNVLNSNDLKVVIFDEADILLGAESEDHCSMLVNQICQKPNLQLLGFTATANQKLIGWFDKVFQGK